MEDSSTGQYRALCIAQYRTHCKMEGITIRKVSTVYRIAGRQIAPYAMPVLRTASQARGQIGPYGMSVLCIAESYTLGQYWTSHRRRVGS
eukprot:3941298-Rhodomonas_salina.4